MGQYHYTVNLDKREFLHPHKLGDGLKLLEQVNSEGGVLAALHILLACSNGRGGGDYGVPAGSKEFVGRWAGDRIAVVGDYAERDDLKQDLDADLIYDLCCSTQDEYGAGLAGLREFAPVKADRMSKLSPYLDISDDMLALLADNCDIHIDPTEDGWRTKHCSDGSEGRRGLAPDMIIGMNPASE